jgi:hypothetical protein
MTTYNVNNEVLSTLNAFETRAVYYADQATQLLSNPVVDEYAGTGAGNITVLPNPLPSGYSWALGVTAPTRRQAISFTEPTAPIMGALPGVDPWTFNSTAYSAQIADRLIVEIERVLDGSTLISDALWNRLRSRAVAGASRQYAMASRKARSDHAARGHALPGITLLAREADALAAYRGQVSEVHSKITEEQAKQVREDLWAAVQQGLAADAFFGGLNSSDQERVLKSTEAKINSQIAQQGAVLGVFKTQADVFGSIWGGIKTKVEALNAEFSADAEVFKTQVAAESERLKALGVQYDSAVKYVTAKMEADTEVVKTQLEYWKAELSARTSWQGHVASVFAQLGGSFASAANISAGTSQSIGYGYNMSYSQQMSRSYGVSVSVPIDGTDEPVDLDPTLSAAPTYVSW